MKYTTFIFGFALFFLSFANADTTVLNQTVGTMPFSTVDQFQINSSTDTEPADFEFLIQNGDGLDYFPQPCNTGSKGQQASCKAHNHLIAAKARIDRPMDLEIKLNGVTIINRSTFPIEKGQFVYHARLSGQQVLNIYQAGLPMTSTTIKVVKYGAGNSSPIAGFTFSSVNNFIEPSMVSFSGLTSSDPDGVIVDYSWNFGDGSFGQGSMVNHIYESAGQYFVTLTVTDNRGAVASRSENVFIQADLVPPVLSNIQPANGAQVTGNSINLTGESNESLSKVEILVDGAQPILATIDPEDSFKFSANISFINGGAKTILIKGYDFKNNSTQVQVSYNLNFNNPPIARINLLSQSHETAPSMIWLDASASSDADQDPLTYQWNFDDGSAVSNDSKLTHRFESAGTFNVTLTVTDSKGSSSVATKQITLNEIVLPIDPAEIAPPMEQHIVQSKAEEYGFIYSAPDAPQKGVDLAKMDEERITPVHGKVFKSENEPLSGVKITVADHPEYGYTYSREDGEWDLAINGGGIVSVEFEKLGFTKAQRPLDTEKLISRTAPDVFLSKIDEKGTEVTFNSSASQIHESTPVQDESGERKTQVFIPENTTAQLRLPDGSTRSVDSLTIRATEVTVGPNGADRMPGPLPPRSAYTYCADFTADEAIALGAESVEFSKPVPVYVDNYLNIPTGIPVPAGYFNKRTGNWEALKDGIVIKMLGTDSNNRAILDMNGTNSAAGPEYFAAHDITDSELEKIAQRFQPGQSFWRVRLSHFSQVDLNYAGNPAGEPADFGDTEGGAMPTNGSGSDDLAAPPNGTSPANDPTKREICACDIDPRQQTVGEVLNLPGTDFNLYYNTNRSAGYAPISSVKVKLFPSLQISGLNIHEGEIKLEVAGKKIEQSFPTPVLNAPFEYTWDGHDHLGREVYQSVDAELTISYLVDGFYRLPLASLTVGSSFNASYNNISGQIVPARNLYKLSRTYKINLSSPFDRSRSSNFRLFNGWSLSSYHNYDPISRSLFTGEGKFFTAQKFVPVVKNIAGNGSATASGNGLAALAAGLASPTDIAKDAAGNLYLTDPLASEIRKIDKNGVITHVAGNGDVNDFQTDNNGSAEFAGIGKPSHIEVTETGEIYFTDSQNSLIRKIDKDGIISVIAGSGINGLSGDGDAAVSATISGPSDLSIAVDGTLVFADTNNNRIRKIDPNGTISTIDQTATAPRSLITDSKGNIYYSAGNKIYKFDINNQRSAIAGNNGVGFGDYEEFGNATQVYLEPGALALDANEKLYFIDLATNTIKTITPTNTIQTLAGVSNVTGYNGDGLAARDTKFSVLKGLLVDPDGSIVVVDSGNHRIRKIGSELPDHFPAIIASVDGSEVYYFNENGLHTSTKRADTGAVKYTFIHNPDNLLIQVKDAYDKVTSINRDSNGNLTSIVGPFGQTYGIVLDQNNFLNKITDPLNNTTEINYTSSGLITSFKKPEGQTTVYEYGANGRLYKVTEPNGGYKTFVRNSENEVNVTSREGINENFKYATDQKNSTVLNAAMIVPGVGFNGKTESIATGETVLKQDNGTETTQQWSTDPRFPGHAGYISKIISKNTQVGNISYEASTNLSYSILPDGNNFTKTLASSDSLGHQESTTFNSANRSIATISNLGLKSSVLIDEHQKPRVVQIGDTLSPVNYDYDNLGRLTTISQGNRVTTFNYDENGFLAQIIDPENRTTQFTNDKIGRVLKTRTPDSQDTFYSFDKNSNLVGITPPQSAIYQFVVNFIGQVTQFIAPDAPAKSYTYDYDGKLRNITSENGAATSITYWGTDSLEAYLPAFISSDLRVDFRFGASAGLPNPKGSFVTGNNDTAVGSTDYVWRGGWLTGKTSTNVGVITNGFNAAGQITAETSVFGTVNYAYNTDHFLVTAGDMIIDRDNSTGLVLQKQLGTFTENISYNNFGEISAREYKNGGSQIYKESYDRDKLGRITTKTIVKNGNTKALNYEYDLKGRLKKVFEDGTLKDEYTYDHKGNRLSRNSNYSAQYDTQDRIVSYTKDAIQHTVTFNADGTSISDTWPGESIQYSISPLNPLKQVSWASGSIPPMKYSVDGEMKRVGRVFMDPIFGNNVRYYWMYDGAGRLVIEKKYFEHTNRFIYATQSHSPDYMISDRDGFKKYFFIKDQLGSILKVIDESGIVYQELEYDEFGRVLSDSNPGFQPFGFAGGMYDQYTKLVRFGARDYNAETGRWLERDPSLFEGGQENLYVYVNNDPVNKIDPSGLADHDTDKFVKCMIETGGPDLLGLAESVGYLCLRMGPAVKTCLIATGLIEGSRLSIIAYDCYRQSEIPVTPVPAPTPKCDPNSSCCKK